jgi:ubiquinone/menaquinone biosynthesis C-methylase UbiE
MPGSFQDLTASVAALQEMYRVLDPGGRPPIIDI